MGLSGSLDPTAIGGGTVGILLCKRSLLVPQSLLTHGDRGDTGTFGSVNLGVVCARTSLRETGSELLLGLAVFSFCMVFERKFCRKGLVLDESSSGVLKPLVPLLSLKKPSLELFLEILPFFGLSTSSRLSWLDSRVVPDNLEDILRDSGHCSLVLRETATLDDSLDAEVDTSCDDPPDTEGL